MFRRRQKKMKKKKKEEEGARSKIESKTWLSAASSAEALQY